MDESTHDRRAAEATRASPVALVIWLAGGPRIERLGLDPVVIGRGPPADLVVAEATLSREHARVQPFVGGLRIDDLDSKNGLHVRGRRVASAELFPGDTCELGDLRISVTSLSRSVAGPAPTRSDEAVLDRLDLELAAARTFGRPLAIALVAPGPSGAVRAALSAAVRPVDAVGPYADDLVLVVVAQGDAATATRLIEGALGGDGRAGIAACPPTEPDAQALLAAARGALATAGAGCVEVAAPRASPPPTLVAASAQMRAVLDELRRWAPAALPALILGETGTGKELIAREIHRASGRAGPFRTINCGAVPEASLERVLFGHVPDASAAAAERAGVFEEAAQGTVFLDEIAELPLAAQAALVRVLDRGQVTPVGAVAERAVDARVVAATHRDLEAMIRAGTFRADLYYRLNALSVALPPLRARPEDLVELAAHFLRDACAAAGKDVLAIDGAVTQALLDHAWPGNVRELRNTMARAALVAVGDSLSLADLPEALRASAQVRVDDPDAELASVAAADLGDADADADAGADDTGTGVLRDRLREVEIRLIVRALDQAKGNQGVAAKLLGLPKRTLVYKLARFGLRRVGRYEPTD
ncbi:MAG: sigma 54-interacting transcriptional regulator [Myxococcales bacterium]|nr:sigma 54-interacting transcriptional regulator [Myxococcales bacterium]